jgi:hypothetical protein
MIRISLPWIVEVVRAVDALEKVQTGKTNGQVWTAVYSAKNQLEALFNQSFYGTSLRSCRESANALHETLTRAIEAKFDDPVNDLVAWQVGQQREKFKTVFFVNRRAKLTPDWSAPLRVDRLMEGH